jgi:hydroxyethylthiazole kinase
MLEEPGMPVKVSKFVVEAADHAAAVLAKIRAATPRIHSITNSVGQQFTANMLLAAGAVPSMTTSAEEIGDFVTSAQGLLINLGTLDDERRHAIGLTLVAARAKKIPWVLDPVFVDRSPSRLALARTLLQRDPAVVRLNLLEFSALAGGGEDQIRRVAQQNSTVVALTGAADTVTDGRRLARIENGHVLMSKVTAMGCAGSALVAAALAVEPDAWIAATGALTVLGIAGEIAARRSKGPGMFAAAILDAVYEMTADVIHERARVIA